MYSNKLGICLADGMCQRHHVDEGDDADDTAKPVSNLNNLFTSRIVYIFGVCFNMNHQLAIETKQKNSASTDAFTRNHFYYPQQALFHYHTDTETMFKFKFEYRSVCRFWYAGYATLGTAFVCCVGVKPQKTVNRKTRNEMRKRYS